MIKNFAPENCPFCVAQCMETESSGSFSAGLWLMHMLAECLETSISSGPKAYI